MTTSDARKRNAEKKAAAEAPNTMADPELVEAFKTAWHEADRRGHTGRRVDAGIAAVLPLIEAAVLRKAHDEIHRLDPPSYFDAPEYRDGLVDGYHLAAAVCSVMADEIENGSDVDARG